MKKKLARKRNSSGSLRPPEKPETTAAENPTNTTIELHGAVNPVSPSNVSWFFEYAPGSSCTGAGVLTTPVQGPEEVAARAAEASLTGLQSGTEYTVCLVSENEANVKTLGNGVSFTTTALKPAISEESFSDVGSNHATVSALIDGQGLSTTYRVQYGTSEAYGSETSPQALPAGAGPVAATAELAGLTHDTIYYFRIITENQDGKETAAGMTFTTLSPGIQGLPDERAFEMVTPPDNQNANVYTPEAFDLELLSDQLPTKFPFQVAADGSRIAYIADPTSEGFGKGGHGIGDQYLATRSPDGGWSQANVQPNGYSSSRYQGFSSDLSAGFLTAGLSEASLPPLSSEAPGGGYGVLYSRDNEDGTYRPLFTNAVTLNRSNEEFGSTGRVDDENGFLNVPAFAGSAGSGNVLFEANDALLVGADRLKMNWRKMFAAKSKMLKTTIICTTRSMAS